MVLYRKYRPQLLSELDITEVRNKLIRSLSSSFLAHAYLFSGPKGTGKTSAARIVAKILNCDNNNREKVENLEPCNKCDSCKAIQEGSLLDVLEIDAASNRGIDEIRDLREKIKLAPVSAKYKVYIIDEVHMLTNEAFNALLKTLEEPPQHAVFVLATTEPERLPDTIQSRCLSIKFQMASDEEIVHSLERVIKGEKMPFSKDMLLFIAQFAEGSFRDATKLLEQSFAEKVKNVRDLEKMLNKGAIAGEEFLMIIKDKDTAKLLAEIVKMGDQGADFRLYVTNILNLLHDLLLSFYQIERPNLTKKLTNQFSAGEINDLIKLFSKVYAEMRYSVKPQLPLETAIIDWCEEKKV